MCDVDGPVHRMHCLHEISHEIYIQPQSSSSRQCHKWEAPRIWSEAIFVVCNGYEWLKMTIFIDLDLCKRMPLPICDHLGTCFSHWNWCFPVWTLVMRAFTSWYPFVFWSRDTETVWLLRDYAQHLHVWSLKHLGACLFCKLTCPTTSAELVPLMSRISFPGFQIPMLAWCCFNGWPFWNVQIHILDGGI